MSRSSLKRKIKKILYEVVSDAPMETHRCLGGEVVFMDTLTCIDDLEFRISDAIADRDACGTRTDARAHYNGLLKVMRRKLKQARKLQPEYDI